MSDKAIEVISNEAVRAVLVERKALADELAQTMYESTGSRVEWLDASPALRSLYLERAYPIIDAGWRRQGQS